MQILLSSFRIVSIDRICCNCFISGFTLFNCVFWRRAVNYQEYTMSAIDEIISTENRWNNDDSGKENTPTGTRPSTNLSTTNSARTGQRLNPGLQDEGLSSYLLDICYSDPVRPQIFFVPVLFLEVNSRPSRNHCCRGKAINTTYSECAPVALFIQHTKRMRRFIMSSAACPALPYFSTLSHKRHDFRKKATEHKRGFWFSLQRLPETFFILR
jgi:hypothetical protein